MKYEIKIMEQLSRVISIEANSIDEAINIVEEMYKIEEVVLDASDFDGLVSIEENIKIE